MTDVTCAVIRNDEGQVLVVQRGEKTDHPFKWEFPGGKTTTDESHEDCIIREIREELEMDIVILQKLPGVEHDYGHKRIRLIPFVCDTLDELPVLREHLSFRWVDPPDLMKTDLCEADIVVAGNYLSSFGQEPAENRMAQDKVQADFNESDLKQMINNMMSMQEADWMATSALENPVLFRKLLEYSYTGESKLAFRASWILTKVCDKFPDIIKPYLADIVDSLQKFDNESVVRSFLRILSLNDISKLTEKHHGMLADYCFSALNSPVSAIAVKVYSMEILFNLSVIYPQLANELAVSVRSLMEEGTAAIVSRGNSILKKISSLPLG